jgi:amino acid transporter
MADDRAVPDRGGREGEPLAGEALLESLGYKQELRRRLSFWNNVGLALADITPMGSLLIIGSVVIATAGTGSIWSYVIGCFIAINVALCMGELGSMYPVAGGLYSIVTRVLGKPIGFLAMLDYIGQAIFLPASIAIGVGTYVQSLWSDAPSNWAAAIVMVGVTVIAMFDIKFNAWFTATFLALQLIVLGLLFVAGVSSLDQPLSIVTDPVVAGDGGRLDAATTGVIVTALATAMFSVNGYDSAINFSEETGGSASQVGRAVVTAAAVGIAFEVVPFLAAVFGADNLQAFLSSDTPLTDVIGSAFGTGFNDVVTVVAILAFLNASLAITLQFARIAWSSGRDRAWPGPISAALSSVSGQGTPWVATLIVGACATALCIRSSLLTVVTFTAVLIIVLYALIAVSALVSRARQQELPRPYRMPLWPVPPLIALGGVVVALTQQKLRDLLVVGGIFVFGFLYFMLFIRPREDRYWTMTTDPEAELQRLASHG